MAFKHLMLMRILNELPTGAEQAPQQNPQAVVPIAPQPEAVAPPALEVALQQLDLGETEEVDAAGDAPTAAPPDRSTPITRPPATPTLACPVCFDSLVDISDPILALDCGHIVCHECFVPMLEEDEPNPHELAQDLSEDEDTLQGLFVPCPVCRRKCKRPRRLYPFWRASE